MTSARDYPITITPRNAAEYAETVRSMSGLRSDLHELAEQYPITINVWPLRHVCESAADVDSLMTAIDLALAERRPAYAST